MAASLGVTVKFWYFCYYASLSTISPFINLYLQRIGLSEQQIGLMAALRIWFSLPAGSLWSGVADKLQAHRAMLFLLFMISTLLRLSLAAAHSFGTVMVLALGTEFFGAAITIIVDAAVMAACSKEGEFGKQRLFASLGWGIFSFLSGAIISQKGIRAAFVCHGTLALLTTVPTALIPVGPLHAKLDGASSSSSKARCGGSKAGGEGDDITTRGTGVLLEVELYEAAGEWGRTVLQQTGRRTWEECPEGQQGSSSGWGTSRSRAPGTMADDMLLAGTAEAKTSSSIGTEAVVDLERRPLLFGPHSDLSNSMWRGSNQGCLARVGQPGAEASVSSDFAQGVGGGSGGDSIVGHHDKHQHPSQSAQLAQSPATEHYWEEKKQWQLPVQYWQGLRQLLRNPHAVLFFVEALIMGYGVGCIEGYLFLYLDSLGASETLMGLSLTVTCAAEFLVFLVSGHILQALGNKLCMHLVFLAFLVRLLCYATLAQWGSPWKVLPVELLHGFTFALAWGAGTAFVSKIAPPGLETTTQALFQGLYYGLGYGIGGLVGGILYQHQGPQRVFWVAFTVMLAGWLLSGLAELYLHWFSPGEPYLPQAQADSMVACDLEGKDHLAQNDPVKAVLPDIMRK